MNVKVVDAFCGVGGLTYGLKKAGLNVTAGFDIDETCQYAYEANNRAKFIKKDIKTVTNDDLAIYYKDADRRVLVGCAPCQPFSSYSRTASEETRKEKWFLLEEFSRLIAESLPDVVSMENVPDLRFQDVFFDFVKSLEDLDYHVSYDVLYCPDYGIPQNRRRLVLLASRLGDISLPEPTHSKAKYITVKKAIGKLPALTAGEIDKDDTIHRSSKLSDLNLKRIHQSVPGGSWLDWDEELVAECHKKDSGSSYGSVYGRMRWDSVSPTITTQFYGFGNGRFGHPEQDRALSLREGAILQSFPKNYKFVEPEGYVSIKHLSRHIGNAVPPRLGEVIGRRIKRHLKEVS